MTQLFTTGRSRGKSSMQKLAGSRWLYILRIIFQLQVAALMSSCASGTDRILEYKDVQNFKISELKDTHGIVIDISGLAFHSSLAVDRIEAINQNNETVVLVHLVPARSGLSGTFYYELRVDDGIDSVGFGTSKHVIWKRGSGPVTDAAGK